MLKRTKAKAALLSVLFAFVMLFSEVFIITHSHHEHDNHINGKCSVCLQIQNAENLLKQIGNSLSGSMFVFTALAIAVIILCGFICFSQIITPVNLKVRINS